MSSFRKTNNHRDVKINKEFECGSRVKITPITSSYQHSSSKNLGNNMKTQNSNIHCTKPQLTYDIKNLELDDFIEKNVLVMTKFFPQTTKQQSSSNMSSSRVTNGKGLKRNLSSDVQNANIRPLSSRIPSSPDVRKNTSSERLTHATHSNHNKQTSQSINRLIEYENTTNPNVVLINRPLNTNKSERNLKYTEVNTESNFAFTQTQSNMNQTHQTPTITINKTIPSNDRGNEGLLSPFSKFKNFLIDNIERYSVNNKKLSNIVTRLEQAKDKSKEKSQRGSETAPNVVQEKSSGDFRKYHYTNNNEILQLLQEGSPKQKQKAKIEKIKKNSYNIKREYSDSLKKTLRSTKSHHNYLGSERENDSRDNSYDANHYKEGVNKVNYNRPQDIRVICEIEELKNPNELSDCKSNTKINNDKNVEVVLDFQDNMDLILDEENDDYVEEEEENEENDENLDDYYDNTLISDDAENKVSDILQKYAPKTNTAATKRPSKKRLSFVKTISKKRRVGENSIEGDHEIEEFCRIFDGNPDLEEKIIEIRKNKSTLERNKRKDHLCIDLGVDIEYNETLKKYFFESPENLLLEPASAVNRDLESIKTKSKNLLNSIDYYKKLILKLSQEFADFNETKNIELEEIKSQQKMEVNKLISKFIEINPSIKNLIDIDSYNQFLKEKEAFKARTIQASKVSKNSLKMLLNEWNKIQAEDYLQLNSDQSLSELKKIVKKISLTNDEANKKENLMVLSSVLKSINDEMKICEEKRIDYEEEEEKVMISKEQILKDLKEILCDEMFSETQKGRDSVVGDRFTIDVSKDYDISINNLNIIGEKETVDGLVTYYDNGTRSVRSKDQKSHARVFQDGFSYTLNDNKNIKIKYPDGDFVVYYANSGSYEIRNNNHNYILYKFNDGQLEKHFRDGTIFIKYSDSTLKIIKPSKEEILKEENMISVYYREKLVFSFELNS